MTSRPETPLRPASPHAARAARVATSVAGAAAALAMVIGGFMGSAERALIPRAAATPSDQTEADEFGYLDSAARCDADQTLVAYGRTSRAQVAICLGPGGELQYRGVRSSDGAFLMLPAGRSAGGSIVATNGDATYAVSPSMLLVSEGDSVVYRGSWIEFRETGFGSGATSSSPSPSPSSSPSSSSSSSSSSASPAASQTPTEPTSDSVSEDSPSEVPTTTVSTTTVTITAEAG